jgi:class 3 adenylate cyclase
MTHEQEIELHKILESGLSYSQKVQELMALCNKYSNTMNLPSLLSTAEALDTLGKNNNNENTQAWGILFRGFWHSYRAEFDEALKIFQLVLPIFERNSDKTGIARVTTNMGRLYFIYRKDLEKAKEYLEKALIIEREIANIQGIARVLLNLQPVYLALKLLQEYNDLVVELLPLVEKSGETLALSQLLNNLALQSLVHLSNIPIGLEYAEKARILCVECGDKLGESRALDSLGAGYWYLGDAGRSIEYYSKSILAGEEAGHQMELVNRLTNASYSYMLLNDYEKVYELNLRAKSICVKENRVDASGWAEMGIGQALLGMGNAEQALQHNQTAIALLKAENDFHGLGYAYFRCGEALVVLGRYEEAFESFNQSHENRKHSSAKGEIAEVQCERGKLLARFGFTDEALTLLNEALMIADSIGAKAQIHTIHRALSDVYQSLGDIPKALYHLQQFITTRDAVQSQANAKKAASLDYLHKQEIQRKEQEATDRILNNILPISISKRLKSGQTLIADTLPSVTVLFTDVVGFTPLAAQLSAEDLVKLLAFIFKHFDGICRKYGLEKIKTIGDAYMAVAGAPEPCDDHALRCANAALEMLEDFSLPVDLLHENIQKEISLDFRIGLHTGSVVAGVIGENKFAYDLWGDAVNTASRMESHGEAGKIHVSEEFAQHLTLRQTQYTAQTLFKGEGLPVSFPLGEVSVERSRNGDGVSYSFPLGEGRDGVSYSFPLGEGRDGVLLPRGEIEIKGKGMMRTYFLERA